MKKLCDKAAFMRTMIGKVVKAAEFLKGLEKTKLSIVIPDSFYI